MDGATGTLRFANGADAYFDLLVYVPTHVAPEVVERARLLGESGWAAVDRHTMEIGAPGVYAIGDVTGIPLVIGMPMPKAGVFAYHQAEAVAQTIASQITGRGNGGRYEEAGSASSRSAVARRGSAGATSTPSPAQG